MKLTSAAMLTLATKWQLRTDNPCKAVDRFPERKRERYYPDTELAQIGPEITRKDVAAVDLVGARRDAISGKPPHAIAQHVGGLAQAEVKTANIIHAHVGRSRRMTAVPGRDRSSITINARP